MSDEQPSADIMNIWLNQPVKGNRMSLEDMQARADKFQAQMRWGVIFSCTFSIIVLAASAYVLWAAPLWTSKVGYSLFLAAAALVLWQQLRWNATKVQAQKDTVTGIIQFHRRELVGLRDRYRRAHLTFLMPFATGFCLTIGGHYAQLLQHNPVNRTEVLGLTFVTVIIVLVFAVGWQTMKIEALKLHREIEEFDRLTGA